MELKEELMTNISLQLPHPPNSSPAAVASSREDTQDMDPVIFAQGCHLAT